MILVLASGTVTSDCCGDEGLLLVVRVVLLRWMLRCWRLLGLGRRFGEGLLRRTG